MYAAFELNMPYICELLFRDSDFKQKQLMVIDILINCDENLDIFLEKAYEFGALKNMIYIAGGSLYDLFYDDEKRMRALKKYDYNCKKITLGMSDDTKEMIKTVFMYKNTKERNQIDNVVSNYKQLIKTKKQGNT